ncbi:MAG: HEAT repeat domain-containing protein [Actinobacteria bacterium]|nr:HEAT repeat domain-containing protein [Actinomycetota bacterium]
MDLEMLKDTPSWEWPEGAGKVFLGVLHDDQADESDRVLAAELAGDFVVINDELADALLPIVLNGDEPEELRARAAISLGPALECAYTYGFEDPDDVPITEDTFRRIQESLHKLYMDAAVGKEVRRRVLEASVRATEDWHRDAILAAYSSDDEGWRLTAVFCMAYVRGFDDLILEALEDENPDIHYEAVRAAGEWQLDAAWPHVTSLVVSEETDKYLLLAAIDAVTNIRPREAGVTLVHLTDSDDEDIVEAADEAIGISEALSELGELDEDEDDGFTY